MKHLNKTALLLAVSLTALLAVAGCGQPSDIYQTAEPIKGGKTGGISKDWEAICIDGVKYIFKSAGGYGGALAPYLKQDGTLHTCDS